MSISVAKRSVLAGVVLFVVAFCAFYVGIEHPAYFWDWGGYFNIYKEYGRLILSGDWSWPAKLGTDVANADYNPTSILPLMPVYALLGDGRTAYVAATAVVYLIPAVLCAMALAGALERVSGKAVALPRSGAALHAVLGADVARHARYRGARVAGAGGNHPHANRLFGQGRCQGVPSPSAPSSGAPSCSGAGTPSASLR